MYVRIMHKNNPSIHAKFTLAFMLYRNLVNGQVIIFSTAYLVKYIYIYIYINIYNYV